METASPKMIAAAWAAWHSRHGGKLGPGPAFVEAINAALEMMRIELSNTLDSQISAGRQFNEQGEC